MGAVEDTNEDRSPRVVRVPFQMPGTGLRFMVVTAPKPDTDAAVRFAQTLGEDLAKNQSVIAVVAEGWEIGFVDLSEGVEPEGDPAPLS